MTRDFISVIEDFKHYLTQLQGPLSDEERELLRALYVDLVRVLASEKQQVE